MDVTGFAMNDVKADLERQALPSQPPDGGLAALSLIAGYYRIAADPAQLRHRLALTGRLAGTENLVRAANLLELKSRIIRGVTGKRLGAIPYPAILKLKDGGFAVLAVAAEKGKVRLVDPVTRIAKEMTLEEAEDLSSGLAILVTRRLGGTGVDPDTFGFRWAIQAGAITAGSNIPTRSKISRVTAPARCFAPSTPTSSRFPGRQ